MLVNTMVLGRLQGDEKMGPKEYIAAYGIGSSLMSIILLASGRTFVGGLHNVLP